MNAQRRAHTLHGKLPEIAQEKVAGHQTRRVVGQVDPIGSGELFHALCQTDGVALRGVVHAQVVANRADHDLTRVDAHAHGKAQAVGALQLFGVTPQLLL